MRPGPFAPHERPRKKYTARSYSRSTLSPANRYSPSPPRTAVTIMSIESPSSGREGFHDHRRPLAASDAGGTQAETLPPAPQGVKQVDRDARAGRSERVANRDGTAVHVGLGAVEPQLLLDGEVLRRKRLVHLDEIELLELHAGLLECLAGRGRRADAHILGLDPRHRPRYQPAQGLQAVRRGEILAREHGGRRAVHDPGRVAGGHEPVLVEVRLQSEQYLERGVRPHVLVLAVLDGLPLLLDGDRDHFILEHAGVPRLLGALLRGERDLVHFLAGELVALGQVLRRLGHGESALRVLARLPQEVFEGSGGPAPPTPPGPPHHARGPGHGLPAARVPPVLLAQPAAVRALRDRLEARAAQPVDRHGGDLDREGRRCPPVAGAAEAT